MSFYSENRPEQKKFYSSNAWKNCRDSYVKYARGLCERCLAKGIIKQGEHVHHKIELNSENMKDPEIAFNFDNLELLCRDCHTKEHKPYESTRRKRRYFVDKLTGEVKV